MIKVFDYFTKEKKDFPQNLCKKWIILFRATLNQIIKSSKSFLKLNNSYTFFPVNFMIILMKFMTLWKPEPFMIFKSGNLRVLTHVLKICF